MQNIFKAGKGLGLAKEKVQIYGEYLWKLKEENGEVLRPDYVVEKAKAKSCPLHEYFIWDDSEAAKRYRIWQARYLIGRIEVIVKYDDSEEQMRAFHNIIIKEDGLEDEQGYVTVKDLKGNPDYLQIVLDKATQEIIGWKKRYEQYQKLSKFKPLKKVFKAIKESQKEMVAA